MPKKDGGPAFPRIPTRIEYRAGEALIDEGQEGMSLRDYFAGQALTGLLAAYTGQDTPLPAIGIAAIAAYDYADAMIAERDK